jgi:hypothetical protein
MRSSIETICCTVLALGTGLFGVSNAFATVATVRNQQVGRREVATVALSAANNLLGVNRRNAFFQGAGLLASAASIVGASSVTNPASCSAAADVDEVTVGGKPLKGAEAIMSAKAHGTTEEAVQETLRFGASRKTANKICSFNRSFAEYATYYQRETDFEQVVRTADGPVTFYDR